MPRSQGDVAAATLESNGSTAHLNEAESLAFTDLYDTARLIEEAMAKHLAEEHSMTIADYEVLVRLDGEGGRMRQLVLADRCVTSMRNLTRTMVRLEDRDWIRREKAIGDAQGAFVHLLPAGADALAAAAPEQAEIIRRRLLSCWTTDELDLIGRAMSASAAHLRDLRP